MSKFKELLKEIGQRSAAVLVVLMAPAMMLLAQEMNEKFSMTTQMFLNELKEQAEQPSSAPRRAPRRQTSENSQMLKQRRLIASPDTIGGVAYIPCFIHLKDVNDQSDVRSLGVEVQETFDGLDFITANVPVEQLEQLADIDNVTRIKVAERMRPLTDVARQKTNTDDVLTQSTDAISAGLNTKYDGTGVVLGIIDTGIDFQHIAFKDKNGNSRIKRAYVYDGSTAQEYTTITSTAPTTDDSSEDHGTHTASTAGGSSVTTTSTSVTVTDDHASATYGGMAPGADLYLAGVNGLNDTYLANALKKMVTYADAQGKPLVVSNSWGSNWGPRDGTGEWADLVAQYFGDTHPNHIILFAASNDAGHRTGNEGGGFFVKKSAATSSSPLGTIIRTDEDGGDYYVGTIACAWNASNSTKLYCKLHVLDNSGMIKKTWTVTDTQDSFSGLSTYYSGSLAVYINQVKGKYRLTVYSNTNNPLQSKGNYTLAIEVYPSSGSANINMWAGDWSYFTDHLTTSGHTWTDGTDDMCVSDEATIPDAISVGAYVSKNNVNNYQGNTTTFSSGSVGDIAYFSSYATAEQSPTGKAYPWISAPGSQVVAGVNHYHTSSDSYSYYNYANKSKLVVNSSTNPYGAMQGTSMATPVAAGIVALWLQAAQSIGKDLTVNDVKEIMAQTAINDSYTTTGANASHFGKGKIDALAGIQYILSPESPLVKASSTYAHVEDASTLQAGDKILIAYIKDDYKYVLSTNQQSTTQQTNNRIATEDFTINEDGTLTPGDAAQVITLEKDGNNFLFNVGTGYLCAASSSSNYLKTKTSIDANSKASINIEGGDATIKFQGSYTRNLLGFNKSTTPKIFSCYGGTSTNIALPQIYREETTVIFNNYGTRNANLISSLNDKKADVTLTGRTLYKDGTWNTLCLPFSVTIADSPLAGADVRALRSASRKNDIVTLNFTPEGEVTEIAAGTPYIIKWDTGTDITEPEFKGVTISSANNDFVSSDGKVRFMGTYDLISFNEENQSIRFMGGANTLNYPLSGARIGAFRSYFLLSDDASAKQIVLNFDGTFDPDAIASPLRETEEEGTAIYNLAGQQIVNGQWSIGKLPRGIYIHNGRKVVK